jgi:hypothetical protein
MALFVPVNYRQFLDVPDMQSDYLHNSIVYLRTDLSINDLQRASIAKVAEKIRLATLRYKTPRAIQEQLSLIENNLSRLFAPKYRGSTKWGISFVSSWTTFDYMSLDFSGASSQGRKVSPTFVLPNLTQGFPLDAWHLNMFTQKDGENGYWLHALNTPSGWNQFKGYTDIDTLLGSAKPQDGEARERYTQPGKIRSAYCT